MIFWECSKITDFQGSRDLSRAVKFSHGDHAQNRGVRDKSRDLGTLSANVEGSAVSLGGRDH